MEILNPELRLQNMQGAHWLVTVTHQWDQHQGMQVTVLVPRSDAPAHRLQLQALQAASQKIALLIDRLEKGTATAD